MIVVGLCGVVEVGKDAGAAALVRDLGFVRIGFADTLREALNRLNPLVVVPFELGLSADGYASLKDVVDLLGWDTAKREIEDIRRLLQRMGTEVGRALISDTVWIDVVFNRAYREGIDRLVIPDVRFVNERQAVTEHHGIVLRITRPGFGPVNNHVSDNALTDADFDPEDIIANNTDEADYQLRLVDEVALLIKRGYFD